MPSAMIHYFSGTGNTYHTVSLIRKKLEDSGYTVAVNRVECGTMPPENKYDLHVFAFPVYAADVPDVMIKYLHRLPPGNGSKAAVLSVYGKIFQDHRFPGDQGDPGSSYDHARSIISRKGYDVLLTGGVGYPHSITQFIPPPDEAEELAIKASSDEKVKMFADRIVAGDRDVKSPGLIVALLSYPFGFLYGLMGRRGLGKMFVADSKCISCGKCEKACPSKTITLINKKPSWNWDCQGCQRCINICPVKAIQTSIMRLAIMWLGIPALLMAYWIAGPLAGHYYLKPDWLPGIMYDVFLFMLGWTVLLYPADKLILALEFVPGIRKIMELSFTRKYRRYLDSEFKPLNGCEKRL
ncbi:EFR1 family ferrodoxin [Methanooceanicella nereidis]|nr:EFR1 family ferrodoxin [Methanocella sp. CWC-04]